MKFLKKIKKGFTLVELVIVIAVIAVLSAVLIPVFGNVIKSSKVSALKSNLKTCSSNLIMYAQNVGVDYYTVNDVKEYLESSGISTTEPVLDGYSIWFNQKNMNFSLVENKKLSSFVQSQGGSVYMKTLNTVASVETTNYGISVTNKTSGIKFASGGVAQTDSSKVDKLGRRPEALTSDKNLLFINGDKEANAVKDCINFIYETGDAMYRIAATNSGSYVNTLNSKFNSVSIMKQIDWDINEYTACFNPDKTAWLSSDGSWYTNAADGKVNNIVVSSNLGTQINEDGLAGQLNYFSGGQIVDASSRPVQLSTSCAVEISSSNEIKFGINFFKHISESVRDIYYVGKVSVTNPSGGTVGGNGGGQSIITAGGVAGKINEAVSSGNYSVSGGGSSGGSQLQYVSKEFSSGKSKYQTPQKALGTLYNIVDSGKYDANGKVVSGNAENAYEKLYYRLPNGTIDSELVASDKKAEWYQTPYVGQEPNKKAVQFKFIAPTMSLNLVEFTKEFNIKEIKSFVLTEIDMFGYHTISLFGTYEENPQNGQTDGLIRGINFNAGVGYVNYFDSYYSFQKDNDGEIVYNAVAGATAETQTPAGSLLVSLPNNADKLYDFTNKDLYITVKYKKATRYYKEEISAFGGTYKKFIMEGTDNTSETISKKASDIKTLAGTYVINFNDATPIDLSEYSAASDYYQNIVQIESIVFSLKEEDKPEKIIIVKYFDTAANNAVN